MSTTILPSLTPPTRPLTGNVGGYVYVLFLKGTDFAKVGCTHYIEERVRSLQLASPFELVAELNFHGTYEDEKELHSRLRHLRERGEWFRGQQAVRVIVAGYMREHDLQPLSVSIKPLRKSAGGKRAGAGRKPRDAAGAVKSYSVALSPTEADHCKEIAGGRGDTARDTSATVQDGIRLLVRRSMGAAEEETPL